MSTLVLLLVVAIWISIALFICRPVGRQDVAWFAAQHQLVLTASNGGMIIDYLARTRRWRLFGAVGAIAFGFAINQVWFDNRQNFNLFVVLFAGWFAGGIFAELWVGRGQRRGPRSAGLVERRLILYVVPAAKQMLMASWLVGAAALSLRSISNTPATVETQPNQNIDQFIVSDSPAHSVVRLIVLSAAIAIVAVAGIRNVVRRPQPAAATELLAADNAVRTAAVTRIAAGWIVLQFIIDGWLLSGVASNAGLSWLRAVLAIAIFIGIVVGWAYVPTRIAAPPGATDGADLAAT